MRVGTKVLIAVALGLVLLAWTPSTARAHAEYVSSVPEPYEIYFGTTPTRVLVTLSEAVQPGSASIRVTNLTGVQVDSGSTTIDPVDPSTFSVATPGLLPSVYTVTWSAISADDGHFSVGTFYFMIRNPDGTLPGQFPQTGAAVTPPPSPVEVALMALEFFGFSIAFGTAMFVGLIWRPARVDLDGDATVIAREGEAALMRLARVGAILYASAVIGLLALTVGRLPAASWDALASPFMVSLLLRIAFGLGMVLLLTLLLRASDASATPNLRPLALICAIALGFAAILVDAFVTHSATLDAWWPLAPLMDATHLYGVAVWVGGLLALVRVRRWLRGEAAPAFVRLVLVAFSRFALVALGLVILAGAFLAFVLVGSVDGLLSTGYGWVVLAKSALVVPMAVLGGVNHRALSRPASDEGRPPTLGAVERRVRAEAVLGATILALAGLLTTITPSAFAPTATNFTRDATNGGLYAIFQVFPYPQTPGNYTFTLEAWLASNGSAFIDVDASPNNTLTFSLVGSAGPPVVVPLEGPHGLNHFYAITEAMDQPGTWAVAAILQRTNGSLVTFPFQVPLHP